MPVLSRKMFQSPPRTWGFAADEPVAHGLGFCRSEVALDFLVREEARRPSKTNSERNKAIRKLQRWSDGQLKKRAGV